MVAMIAALALYSCANIGRPEGGPRDLVPPVYVNSNPVPNQLNYKGEKVEIEFNEYIQLKDHMKKVVVSPAQKNMPIIRGLGRKVTVELRDTLLPNTTYCIDFADCIQDNNEGNPIDGFSIAFSTGDTIDSLQVSGMMLRARDLEPMQSVIVGLQENLADSAFSKLPLSRIARTNEYGQFTIRNLKPGRYHVFGLNDMDGNYTYSRNEGDFHAENIRKGNGKIIFDFVTPQGVVRDIDLGVPVDINIENAVAAMAVCHLVGATDSDLRNAIATFGGAKRRFDFWIKEEGEHGKVVLDDYAHHPDELRASIRSIKDLYPHRKVTAIFQPHLYSRTRDFAPQFAEALSHADRVILLDIYPAREKPIPGVTSQIIFDRITCPDKMLIDKAQLLHTIETNSFDILLTVGAGDIVTFLPQICEIIKNR